MHPHANGCALEKYANHTFHSCCFLTSYMFLFFFSPFFCFTQSLLHSLGTSLKHTARCHAIAVSDYSLHHLPLCHNQNREPSLEQHIFLYKKDIHSLLARKPGLAALTGLLKKKRVRGGRRCFLVWVLVAHVVTQLLLHGGGCGVRTLSM